MDTSKQYDVFISYRSVNSTQAGIVFTYLAAKKYRVFMDTEGLGAGRFDDQLYRVLDQVTDLVLILTENTLGGCMREDDWIRNEVGYALRHGKNVVPYMFDYTIPADLPLPEELKALPSLHGVMHHQDVFMACLEKLSRHLTSRPLPAGQDAADEKDEPPAFAADTPPADTDGLPPEPEVEIRPVQPTGRRLTGQPRYTKKDLETARGDLLEKLREPQTAIEEMLGQERIDSRAAYRSARTAMIYVDRLMGAYDWSYEPETARGRFINNFEPVLGRLRAACAHGAWMTDEMKKLLRQYSRGLRDLMQTLSNER